MNILILVLFIAAVVFAVLRFNKNVSSSQPPSKKGGGRSEYTQKEKDR